MSDVNDNAPIITSPASAVVWESTPPGHAFHHVHAMDADEHANAKLTYVILGEKSFVDINSTSGMLLKNLKNLNLIFQELSHSGALYPRVSKSP